MKNLVLLIIALLPFMLSVKMSKKKVEKVESNSMMESESELEQRLMKHTITSKQKKAMQ